MKLSATRLRVPSGASWALQARDNPRAPAAGLPGLSTIRCCSVVCLVQSRIQNEAADIPALLMLQSGALHPCLFASLGVRSRRFNSRVLHRMMDVYFGVNSQSQTIPTGLGASCSDTHWCSRTAGDGEDVAYRPTSSDVVIGETPNFFSNAAFQCRCCLFLQPASRAGSPLPCPVRVTWPTRQQDSQLCCTLLPVLRAGELHAAYTQSTRHPLRSSSRTIPCPYTSPLTCKTSPRPRPRHTAAPAFCFHVLTSSYVFLPSIRCPRHEAHIVRLQRPRCPVFRGKSSWTPSRAKMSRPRHTRPSRPGLLLPVALPLPVPPPHPSH